MALWISKLMNTVCRPLVTRISAELAPKQAKEISALKLLIEQSVVPTILPLVVRNELEHLQGLPRTFLHQEHKLTFIGYTSQELVTDFPSAALLAPPVNCPIVLSGDSLIFLDEYHFVELIRTVPTMFSGIQRNILMPYQGAYMPEVQLRQLLHQLGFPEIFILDYDKLLDNYSINGVSNPVPVSSLPYMVTPSTESDASTRWLVANRIPIQT